MDIIRKEPGEVSPSNALKKGKKVKNEREALCIYFSLICFYTK